MKRIKLIIPTTLLLVATMVTSISAQLLSNNSRELTVQELLQRINYQIGSPKQYETQLADILMGSIHLSDSDTRLMLETIIDSVSNHQQLTGSTMSLMDGFYNHPNSPYRSEQRYIYILKLIIANPKIAEEQKLSPKIVLEQLLKNSVGEKAANFNFESIDGSKGSLSGIDALYTILFFNDPECAECNYIKKLFISSPLITNRSDLKILALYPDADLELWRNGAHPKSTQWINAYDLEQSINNQQIYHITALPTLYLLDHEKRVVLKDVTPGEIIEYISKLKK